MEGAAAITQKNIFPVLLSNGVLSEPHTHTHYKQHTQTNKIHFRKTHTRPHRLQTKQQTELIVEKWTLEMR